ncbi:hypothetical protein LZ30DRAFT_136519 [Colletotrichum cereale]|nr:hypothetical protein LZ30DRAFT_136519 [Colletotrichum cereale]
MAAAGATRLVWKPQHTWLCNLHVTNVILQPSTGKPRSPRTCDVMYGRDLISMAFRTQTRARHGAADAARPSHRYDTARTRETAALVSRVSASPHRIRRGRNSADYRYGRLTCTMREGVIRRVVPAGVKRAPVVQCPVRREFVQCSDPVWVAQDGDLHGSECPFIPGGMGRKVGAQSPRARRRRALFPPAGAKQVYFSPLFFLFIFFRPWRKEEMRLGATESVGVARIRGERQGVAGVSRARGCRDLAGHRGFLDFPWRVLLRHVPP